LQLNVQQRTLSALVDYSLILGKDSFNSFMVTAWLQKLQQTLILQQN